MLKDALDYLRLQPDQWHDLFEAIAGASAALAGLIFVAVSLNLRRQILQGHALPSLAVVCTAPMVVAGASTPAGAGGGLYRALAEIVCGLVASVFYAWVLLVEILASRAATATVAPERRL